MRPSHLSRSLSLVAGVVLSLASTSCHKATDARMTVRRSEPRAGSVDVDPTAEVRVVFSYRVDMSTVNESSFRVVGDVSGPIAGSFTYDDETRTVAFVADDPFASGENISVSLASTIRSTAGTSLSRRSFGFAVIELVEDPGEDPGGEDPDPDPPEAPQVVRRSPTPLASSVPHDETIEIEFSHFLNPFLVSVDAVSVVGEISGPVPVRLEGILETGNVLRLVPQRPFASGERVLVSVFAGLLSAEGGVFEGDAFTFHVASDAVVDERDSVPVSANGRVSDLLVVDLDGDGIAEIVYSSENSSVVDVLRHVGEGSFEVALSLDLGATVLSLGSGDMDNDGDIDLLFGLDDRLVNALNETTAETGIEISWGPDTVTRAGVRAILVTDLDHRAPHDVILETDTGLKILRAGLGVDASQAIGASRRSKSALVDTDINGDGHIDLAYLEVGGRTIAYHLGSSTGELDPATIVTLDGELERLEVDDFDGDGAADLLALLLVDVSHPDSPFRLLSRDPETGLFPSIDTVVAAATTLESFTFVSGDLDGDGSLDLVLGNQTGSEVSIFDSVAPGDVFPADPPQTELSVPEPGEIRLADIGGDGGLDVVIASGNELRILLSDGVAAPPPPPPVENVFEFHGPDLVVRQGDAGIRALLTLDNSVPLDGASVLVGFDPRVVTNPSFDTSATVLEGAEFSASTLHEADNAISYHAILEFLPPFEGNAIPAGSGHELLRLLFDVPADAPIGDSELSFPAAAGLPIVVSSVFVGGEEHLPDLFAGTIHVEVGAGPPPSESPDRLRVGSATVTVGNETRVPVIATSERGIEAFSVVVAYPSSDVEILEITIEGSASADLEPEMVVPSDHPADGFFAMSVLYDLLPPFENKVLPADESHVLFHFDVRPFDDTTPGNFGLNLTDGLGDPPLDNLFSEGGQSYFPAFEHGVLTVLADLGPVFLRGDVEGNGNVDSGDAIYLLDWVFRAGPDPRCMDAADANDDGQVNVTDATWILDFTLHGGTRPPLPPYPEPGIDPTEDGIGCAHPLSP